MILCVVNQSSVVLQVTAQNPDGSPKITLTSALVRVYHLSGIVEVEDLSTVLLVHVGVGSNIWRYVWSPVTLPVGHYWAEYSLVDSDGTHYHDLEDITVQDVSTSGSVSDLGDSIDDLTVTVTTGSSSPPVIAATVWDEPLALHVVPGTSGKLVGTTAVNTDIIKKVETGRWRIVGTQMIFYNTDGTTPLLTFNLKDIAGLPTNENVFERVPV